ncbi:E3 ubiquitin-protein ligase ATL42-like [Cornus florida]|uniref:E3 ubiquitin-protein ligase ATL42-like n=1 Tax=Cornus florida TaxID=4283 RepID=UPI00289E7B78|nr:E3 ubiquitin-protein ligase ATL42-like [Cornus florida]
MHVHKPLNLSLPLTIGIVTISFSLLFLVVAYAMLCSTATPHPHNPHDLLRLCSRSSGIEKKVIESLPSFKFSLLKGSKEGLECVVCLSKFEDTDILRLLPKCRHAFHTNCIDQWLEKHSSCPLCRYKFDVKDLISLTHSNSLRYPQNCPNLVDDPILELFVQREEDHQRSSSFKMRSSFQKLDESQKELGNNCVHKFKHKIIFSDILYKSRWSDVNSSDLMLLNSEMLSAMSSKRFNHEFAMNEQIVNIQDDIERTTLPYINRSQSSSTSSFASASDNEADQSASSRLLNAADKRSMSEITNF